MDFGSCHFKETSNDDEAAPVITTSKRSWTVTKQQQQQQPLQKTWQLNNIMWWHLILIHQSIMKSFFYLSHTGLVSLVLLLALFLLVQVMVSKKTTTNVCPVGWGCRIHQLHFCRGVKKKPPNECPGYNTKQSNGEVSVMPGALGNAEHLFIAIAPRSTLA